MGWFEELFIDEAKRALEGRNESNSVVLHSTDDSGKKFKITVDDSGKLTATEIVENKIV